MGSPGQQTGGFVVIAIPGSRDGGRPVPERSFRHFATKQEALEAAEQFVAQQEGYEAFVLPAEGYFYHPFA